MAQAPAFQAGYAGSIPVIRSTCREHVWLCSGLLIRRTGFESLAAHAGVAQRERPRAQTSRMCGSDSRRPYSMPGRLMAGQRPLKPRIEVRVLARQLGRRARLRPRSRKAGDPGRHRVAAPCARTPTGREAGQWGGRGSRQTRRAFDPGDSRFEPRAPSSCLRSSSG